MSVGAIVGVAVVLMLCGVGCLVYGACVVSGRCSQEEEARLGAEAGGVEDG